MNFLFHMLLSGSDDQLLVGNFMGDFVKGPLQDRFPQRIRQGLMLHRRIDSYADKNPCFVNSCLRLSPAYGLYRGVLVDMFYDYFLVNNWKEWCSEPFADYLVRTRAVVEEYHFALPGKLQRLVPIIFEELLPSYETIEGIGSALGRLSLRVTRANPLNGSEEALRLHHAGLLRDFRGFTPAMFRFANETVAQLDGSDPCG